MLSAALIFGFLLGAHCIPLDQQVAPEQPAVAQQPAAAPQPAVVQQEVVPQERVKPDEQPVVASQEPPNDRIDTNAAEPQGAVPAAVAGGAPPPGDLAESPDTNPVERSGTSDLDTDSTFGFGWGWGYRPYYRRWGGYYGYPSWGWRRSGWGGRGYYGGGWGGWGGYYW